MSVNTYIGSTLALQDDNLQDAILEGDRRTIIYLANNKHKSAIHRKGCAIEPLNISQMLSALEGRLGSISRSNINIKIN